MAISWFGLKKKGLGTLCHVDALVHMIEENGVSEDYTISNTQDVGWERGEHLRKLGVGVEERPIGDYLARCIGYANSKGFHFEDPFRQQVDV